MPVTSASWKASLPRFTRLRLAGDHDQRRRVHLRGEQARHGVGRARARGHQHHAGPAGGARVAVGHVGGALLVAHQDQLDRRVDERVEDRDRRAAREAEDVLHALALEAADQDLGAGRLAAIGVMAPPSHDETGDSLKAAYGMKRVSDDKSACTSGIIQMRIWSDSIDERLMPRGGLGSRNRWIAAPRHRSPADRRRHGQLPRQRAR